MECAPQNSPIVNRRIPRNVSPSSLTRDPSQCRTHNNFNDHLPRGQHNTLDEARTSITSKSGSRHTVDRSESKKTRNHKPSVLPKLSVTTIEIKDLPEISNPGTFRNTFGAISSMKSKVSQDTAAAKSGEIKAKIFKCKPPLTSKANPPEVKNDRSNNASPTRCTPDERRKKIEFIESELAKIEARKLDFLIDYGKNRLQKYTRVNADLDETNVVASERENFKQIYSKMRKEFSTKKCPQVCSLSSQLRKTARRDMEEYDVRQLESQNNPPLKDMNIENAVSKLMNGSDTSAEQVAQSMQFGPSERGKPNTLAEIMSIYKTHTPLKDKLRDEAQGSCLSKFAEDKKRLLEENEKLARENKRLHDERNKLLGNKRQYSETERREVWLVPSPEKHEAIIEVLPSTKYHYTKILYSDEEERKSIDTDSVMEVVKTNLKKYKKKCELHSARKDTCVDSITGEIACQTIPSNTSKKSINTETVISFAELTSPEKLLNNEVTNKFITNATDKLDENLMLLTTDLFPDCDAVKKSSHMIKLGGRFDLSKEMAVKAEKIRDINTKTDKFVATLEAVNQRLNNLQDKYYKDPLSNETPSNLYRENKCSKDHNSRMKKADQKPIARKFQPIKYKSIHDISSQMCPPPVEGQPEVQIVDQENDTVNIENSSNEKIHTQPKFPFIHASNTMKSIDSLLRNLQEQEIQLESVLSKNVGKNQHMPTQRKLTNFQKYTWHKNPENSKPDMPTLKDTSLDSNPFTEDFKMKNGHCGKSGSHASRSLSHNPYTKYANSRLSSTSSAKYDIPNKMDAVTQSRQENTSDVFTYVSPDNFETQEQTHDLDVDDQFSRYPSTVSTAQDGLQLESGQKSNRYFSKGNTVFSSSGLMISTIFPADCRSSRSRSSSSTSRRKNVHDVEFEYISIHDNNLSTSTSDIDSAHKEDKRFIDLVNYQSHDDDNNNSNVSKKSANNPFTKNCAQLQHDFQSNIQTSTASIQLDTQTLEPNYAPMKYILENGCFHDLSTEPRKRQDGGFTEIYANLHHFFEDQKSGGTRLQDIFSDNFNSMSDKFDLDRMTCTNNMVGDNGNSSNASSPRIERIEIDHDRRSHPNNIYSLGRKYVCDASTDIPPGCSPRTQESFKKTSQDEEIDSKKKTSTQQNSNEKNYDNHKSAPIPTKRQIPVRQNITTAFPKQTVNESVQTIISTAMDIETSNNIDFQNGLKTQYNELYQRLMKSQYLIKDFNLSPDPKADVQEIESSTEIKHGELKTDVSCPMESNNYFDFDGWDDDNNNMSYYALMEDLRLSTKKLQNQLSAGISEYENLRVEIMDNHKANSVNSCKTIISKSGSWESPRSHIKNDIDINETQENSNVQERVLSPQVPNDQPELKQVIVEAAEPHALPIHKETDSQCNTEDDVSDLVESVKSLDNSLKILQENKRLVNENRMLNAKLNLASRSKMLLQLGLRNSDRNATKPKREVPVIDLSHSQTDISYDNDVKHLQRNPMQLKNNRKRLRYNAHTCLKPPDENVSSADGFVQNNKVIKGVASTPMRRYSDSFNIVKSPALSDKGSTTGSTSCQLELQPPPRRSAGSNRKSPRSPRLKAQKGGQDSPANNINQVDLFNFSSILSVPPTNEPSDEPVEQKRKRYKFIGSYSKFIDNSNIELIEEKFTPLVPNKKHALPKLLDSQQNLQGDTPLTDKINSDPSDVTTIEILDLTTSKDYFKKAINDITKSISMKPPSPRLRNSDLQLLPLSNRILTPATSQTSLASEWFRSYSSKLAEDPSMEITPPITRSLKSGRIVKNLPYIPRQGWPLSPHMEPLVLKKEHNKLHLASTQLKPIIKPSTILNRSQLSVLPSLKHAQARGHRKIKIVDYNDIEQYKISLRHKNGSYSDSPSEVTLKDLIERY